MSININLSEISRLVKKARENNVDIILTISADNEDELEIEERPHTGKWIGKTSKCSLCGKWVDPLQGDADMNYCPNCGAKMDGEEQEQK